MTDSTSADSAIENDLEAIRAWIESVGETDQGLVAEILEICERDRATREAYLQSARGQLAP